MGTYDDIAERWRSERGDRLRRRTLDLADFDELRAAGFYDCVVPIDHGGAWTGLAESARPIATSIRTIAAGDPSPALVAAMHPAVCGFWAANDGEPDPGWQEQRDAVLASAARGERWGTVTSEPGSGGDVLRTKAVAVAVDTEPGCLPGRQYAITGVKHFGSGTGTCHFMFTTAVPAGETEPAAFVLDLRRLVAGEQVDGFTVSAPWDGIGMTSTQSHGVTLDGCRAVRAEWPGEAGAMMASSAPLTAAVFAAAVMGVLDEAWATAAARLEPHRDTLRPYEQVEWTRATNEVWLAGAAFDQLLASIERDDHAGRIRSAMHAKLAMAELAESAMTRITRVVGGGTFSERSPFASWFEDVRALGFLRPPWGLAFDSAWSLSW